MTNQIAQNQVATLANMINVMMLKLVWSVILPKMQTVNKNHK
jgi:hypothetical protein